MDGDMILRVNHILGKRMISSGMDGMSRAVTNNKGGGYEGDFNIGILSHTSFGSGQKFQVDSLDWIVVTVIRNVRVPVT